MKFSKQAILARVHKIPSIRFEDQQLTSFGGAIVFQMLFQRLNLKARLKQCFRPVKGSAVFGPHRIVCCCSSCICCWASGACATSTIIETILWCSACWDYVAYRM